MSLAELPRCHLITESSEIKNEFIIEGNGMFIAWSSCNISLDRKWRTRRGLRTYTVGHQGLCVVNNGERMAEEGEKILGSEPALQIVNKN